MPWKKTVTRGSVSVLVSGVESGAHKGSFRVQGRVDGKHKVFGVYKDKSKALDIASDRADELSNTENALYGLSHEQKQACLEVVNAGLTVEDIRAYVDGRDSVEPVTLSVMLSRWFDTQTRRNDYSSYYMTAMRHIVDHVSEHFSPSTMAHSVTTRQLDAWLNSRGVGSKRLKNLRGLLVSAWKWGMAQGYVSENVAAAIAIPKVKKKRGGHEVLLPSEFALMLDNVRESFLPWLTIAGFAGLRNSEICGSPGRMADRLVWEDFDWKRKIISIRPETSKTNTFRHVPVCDALAEWLEPWRGKTGFVHTACNPTHYGHKKNEAETFRLGSLIGGWRNNCLRASRQSYRVADTHDVQLAAQEGGHSPTELRSTYLNTRYKEDAETWFSLNPNRVKSMLAEETIIPIKKQR